MFDKDYIARRREGDGKVQKLSQHLDEVSHLSADFAAKGGLREVGEFIGLLHDIGKASHAFQQYIKSAVGLINIDEDDYVDAAGLKGKIDHSTAGAQIINRGISKKTGEVLFIAQVLSLCLASHHSGLIDCISPEGKDGYSKRMSKAVDKTYAEEILGKLNQKAKERVEKYLNSAGLIKNFTEKFRSLTTIHDSAETRDFKRGLLVRFLFSCLIDADRLSTADFEHSRLAKLRNRGNYVQWSVLIERLNNKLKEYDSLGINAVRQEISQACQDFSDKPTGLYQLTVPTGGGKTFASLRFALRHAYNHKMERIIYVLPYTTIIEQNADAIRKVLEPKGRKNLNSVVLEHHSNLMPEKETARQKILSENWDAPIVLTTSVQVLETLFGSGTRSVRRMHQLANSIIIFDEVQAIPIKCVHMFNTAVNFLVNNSGATVVLCTATQPLLDKVAPQSRSLIISDDHKMVVNEKSLFEKLKRVEVRDKTKVGGWTDFEIKNLIVKMVSEVGNVLVVVNTKRSAQKIYQQCKEVLKVEVVHLSTNMCPAHRFKVFGQVRECLRLKEPIVCISTQLIEAGVDISFCSVIRYLAGLDSIAQAAGRCNRHNELYPVLGQVYVVNSSEENLDCLKDIRIAQEKTERVLNEYKYNPIQFSNNLLSLEAMKQYYEYYFFQRANEMNYPVDVSAVGRNDNLFNMLSTNAISVKRYKDINGSFPSIPLRQSFMSASEAFQTIEISARGVVVPFGKEGKKIINKLCSVLELEKQYQLTRKAQRYSVNVFPNDLKKFQEKGVIREAQHGTGILYLDEQYYSDEFGLSETKINEMGFQNV